MIARFGAALGLGLLALGATPALADEGAVTGPTIANDQTLWVTTDD